MTIDDFQTEVGISLAELYSSAFKTMPPSEQRWIVDRVRQAYYRLNDSTPGSQIDYAVATIWAIQAQFNERLIESETVRQTA